MKFKNIIIICRSKDNVEKLQKYLFRLSYNWVDDYDNRHRQIKPNGVDYYIQINNDDRLYLINQQWCRDRKNLPKIVSLNKKLFRVITYSDFFIKKIRKEKLEKINELK